MAYYDSGEITDILEGKEGGFQPFPLDYTMDSKHTAHDVFISDSGRLMVFVTMQNKSEVNSILAFELAIEIKAPRVASNFHFEM